MSELHTLYSFRRCPYAMRARMGLLTSRISASIIDIDLKDKPQAMLNASPKGTVPVLILNGGTVIDESLDIMMWALKQNDPDNWLDNQYDLIETNDGTFKKNLDRYKYPNRYPDKDCSHARDSASEFLWLLNERLERNKFLNADYITLSDIAIFPFIRQFAHVDKDWFYTQNWDALSAWLKKHLESNLFKTIMDKKLDKLP